MTDLADFDDMVQADAKSVLQWPSSLRPDSRVDFPPAVAVCFIPYYAERPREGGWGSFGWSPRAAAATFVFRTGNPAPAIPFRSDSSSLGPIGAGRATALAADQDSLAAFRSKKEFRACAWIQGCTVALEAGRATIRARLATHLGYTPRDVSPLLRDPATTGDYDIGLAGTSINRVDWHRGGAVLTVQYGFRIRKPWARIGNMIAFQGGVPFMRLKLRYEINLATESAGASFYGTFIPSASYQLGDRRTGTRRMEEATREELLMTLGAGHNQVAPMDPNPVELSGGAHNGG